MFQTIRKLSIVKTNFLKKFQMNWNFHASLFLSARRILFHNTSFHSIFGVKQSAFALLIYFVGIDGDIESFLSLNLPDWVHTTYLARSILSTTTVKTKERDCMQSKLNHTLDVPL